MAVVIFNGQTLTMMASHLGLQKRRRMQQELRRKARPDHQTPEADSSQSSCYSSFVPTAERKSEGTWMEQVHMENHPPHQASTGTNRQILHYSINTTCHPALLSIVAVQPLLPPSTSRLRNPPPQTPCLPFLAIPRQRPPRPSYESIIIKRLHQIAAPPTRTLFSCLSPHISSGRSSTASTQYCALVCGCLSIFKLLSYGTWRPS
jgi:hypothetical protein